MLESKHSGRLARYTLTRRTFIVDPATAGTAPAVGPVFAPAVWAAKTPLLGGQWRRRGNGKYDIVNVGNKHAPEIYWSAAI